MPNAKDSKQPPVQGQTPPVGPTPVIPLSLSSTIATEVHVASELKPRAQVAPSPIWIPLGNIIAMLSLLIAISIWMAYFTDWHVASLSGFFVCIILPILWKALPQERADNYWGNLSQWLDRTLHARLTWKVVLLAFCGLFVLGGNLGTFELMKTSDDSKFRRVEIFDSKENLYKTKHLRERSQKYLIRTDFFSRRTYRVRVAGLPSVTREVKPFRKVLLEVPETFKRLVIIVRPRAWLARTMLDYEFDLRLTLTRSDGRQEVRFPILDHYRGESVWVGGDEDLEQYPLLKQGWAEEIGSENTNIIINLLSPKSIGKEVLLAPGDKVRIEVLKRECAPYASSACAPYIDVIETVGTNKNLPQEVILGDDQ